MSYRLVRTETELKTGIQHIMNYSVASNKQDARSLLYLYLTNAMNANCKIEEIHYEGFTQNLGEFISWKFEIAEYE